MNIIWLWDYEGPKIIRSRIRDILILDFQNLGGFSAFLSLASWIEIWSSNWPLLRKASPFTSLLYSSGSISGTRYADSLQPLYPHTATPMWLESYRINKQTYLHQLNHIAQLLSLARVPDSCAIHHLPHATRRTHSQDLESHQSVVTGKTLDSMNILRLIKSVL